MTKELKNMIERKERLRSILKNEKYFSFLQSYLKFYYNIDINEEITKFGKNENILNEIIDTLDDTDVLSDLENWYIISMYGNKFNVKYYFRKIKTDDGYISYNEVYNFVEENFMDVDMFKTYNYIEFVTYNYIEFVNEFLYNIQSIINYQKNLNKEKEKITSGDIYSFLYIMFKILNINSKSDFYKYVNYCLVPSNTNDILGIRVLKYVTDYVDNKEHIEKIFSDWYFGFDIIIDDMKKVLSRYVIDDLDIETRRKIEDRIYEILKQNNVIILSENEIIINSDILENIFD